MGVSLGGGSELHDGSTRGSSIPSSPVGPGAISETESKSRIHPFRHRVSSRAMVARRGSLAWKLRWVAVVYLAEGLPFGLVIDTVPVYFRVHGVSLGAIGAR